jgi:hypothetical protein
MFNFLTSKPLLLALLVSLSLNGLFGYLSYTFYGAKVKALASLEVALDDNKSLEKSLEKQEMVCKIAEDISVGFQEDKTDVETKTDSALDQLSAMKSTSKQQFPQTKKVVEEENEKTDVASLDSKLPDDVSKLLQSHFDSLQKTSGSNAPESSGKSL